MIIVGSTAAKYWGINRREPLDLDLWFSEEEGLPAPRKGLDISEIPKQILDEVEVYGNYATKDSLYTIKCSHLQWDIKWDKTKADILYMKDKGCKLIHPLYNLLVEYWKTVHGDKSHLSLNKSKGVFFDDHVTYRYDHDYLHELVSCPNKPVYTQLQENEDVLLNKIMFDSLDYDTKVRLFREEITVIACERWIIPVGMCWYKAYQLSLKKTITNLTKNWASDFIIHNIDSFTIPDYEYFKHILTTLNLKDSKMKNKALEDITKLHEDFLEQFEDTDYEELQYFVFALAEDNCWLAVDNKWKEKVGYKQRMQEGGGEGEAEYCEAVFSIGDKNYHCSYSYYSYNGHEIAGIEDTLSYVTPKQKTITTWG